MCGGRHQEINCLIISTEFNCIFFIKDIVAIIFILHVVVIMCWYGKSPLSASSVRKVYEELHISCLGIP